MPDGVGNPIQVNVRIRPSSAEEKQLSQRWKNEVVTASEMSHIVVDKRKRFTFDTAFSTFTSQQSVYDICAKNMLNQFLEGRNCCIMAYGRTGTGKSFTLGLSEETVSATTTASRMAKEGIAPRILRNLFSSLPASNADSKVKLTCSFMQLYDEQVIDLLNYPARGPYDRKPITAPADQIKYIELREDAAGLVHCIGGKDVEIATLQEALNLLMSGLEYRAAVATEMNYDVSQVHTLFQISLRHQSFELDGIKDSKTNQPNGDWKIINSKFLFVDLAGSESLQAFSTSETTSKDGGLSALGKVISRLAEDTARSRNSIPYNDSKLTRLLKDPLGGNFQTLLMACVGPTESTLPDTLNTLKYAIRGRSIRNSPQLNIEYQSELDALKTQVTKFKSQIQQLNDGAEGDPLRLRKENTDLRSQLERLSNELALAQAGFDLKNRKNMDDDNDSASIRTSAADEGKTGVSRDDNENLQSIVSKLEKELAASKQSSQDLQMAFDRQKSRVIELETIHQVAVSELAGLQSRGISVDGIEDLKKQLAAATKSANINRAESDALHKQVKGMETAVQNKDKEMNIMKSKLAAAQADKERAETAEKQLSESMTALDAKNNRIKELEDKFLGDSPHSERTAWQRVLELESWLEKLLIVWPASVQLHDVGTVKANGVSKSGKDFVADIRASIAQTKPDMAKTVTPAKTDDSIWAAALENVQNSFNLVSAQVTDLKQKEIQSKKDLEDLKTRLATSSTELSKLKTTAQQAQIDSQTYKSQIDNFNKQMDSKAKEFTNMSLQLAAVNVELMKRNKDIENLNKQLSEAQGRHSMSLNELKKVKTETEDRVKTVAKEKLDEVANVAKTHEAAASMLSAELEAKKKQVSTLQSKWDELQKNHDSVAAELLDHKTQLQAALTKLSQEEAKGGSADELKVAKLQKEFDSLNAIAKEQSEEIYRLKTAQLTDAQKIADSIRAARPDGNMTDMKLRLSALEEQLNKSKAELTITKKSLLEASNTISSQQDMLSKLKNQLHSNMQRSLNRSVLPSTPVEVFAANKRAELAEKEIIKVKNDLLISRTTQSTLEAKLKEYEKALKGLGSNNAGVLLFGERTSSLKKDRRSIVNRYPISPPETPVMNSLTNSPPPPPPPPKSPIPDNIDILELLRWADDGDDVSSSQRSFFTSTDNHNNNPTSVGSLLNDTSSAPVAPSPAAPFAPFTGSLPIPTKSSRAVVSPVPSTVSSTSSSDKPSRPPRSRERNLNADFDPSVTIAGLNAALDSSRSEVTRLQSLKLESDFKENGFRREIDDLKKRLEMAHAALGIGKPTGALGIISSGRRSANYRRAQASNSGLNMCTTDQD
ncbi:hypothetical protein SmJEL517_g05354 [Synchytrium microbalum]|uniref:Kinesin motor domain-containing protein n=1 Tax=Synchytrium microbalum TaxID=1806994 RepID=A0A507BUM0_9FUNG|nr:uncharacterized protein SmJEL517_g05354 [Synchytrium microbalum]TPX31252.1 hypothetical protein SmJEL517_g05354 [Synchytrium microbalum]